MTDNETGGVTGNQRAAQKVVQGINRIADALKPALGPLGRPVTVNMPDGSERETRHGALIAEGVKLRDPWSDAAGHLLKRAASYAEFSGGGITPVALVVQSLLKACAKAIAAGIDAGELRRGIVMAAQTVISKLAMDSQRVQNADHLMHVGKIAADGDAAIGAIVGETIQRIDHPGMITIVDTTGAKVDLDYRAREHLLGVKPAVGRLPTTSRWLDVATTGLVEPGQVAVIHVDGATPGDMGERRYRVESAFRAALAALEEGVIAGGGSALLHAGKALGELKGTNNAQEMGIDLLRQAVSIPLRQLVKNAGVDSSAVVRSLLHKNDVRIGYDVEKRGYVDMFNVGVIDPARAAKNVVAAAASIASEFTGLPTKPFDFRNRNLRYFLPVDEFSGFIPGSTASGKPSIGATSQGDFIGGGGVTSVGGAEEATPAQQPRRYLVGHFPDRVALDEIATLTAEIAQVLSDGIAAAIDDLHVPKEGLRIDIFVECPGFQLLGSDHGTIDLPPPREIPTWLLSVSRSSRRSIMAFTCPRSTGARRLEASTSRSKLPTHQVDSHQVLGRRRILPLTSNGRMGTSP
jgi:hypothetical protein